MQAVSIIPNCNPSSIMGLYLDPSPRNTISASLVIIIEIEMVYPQFHFHHDDLFETVNLTDGNPMTLSHWGF